VGDAATTDRPLPHLTPTLSAPRGGEGLNKLFCIGSKMSEHRRAARERDCFAPLAMTTLAMSLRGAPGSALCAARGQATRRSNPLTLSCRPPCYCRRLAARQMDRELGELADPAVDGDPAAVLLGVARRAVDGVPASRPVRPRRPAPRRARHGIRRAFAAAPRWRAADRLPPRRASRSLAGAGDQSDIVRNENVRHDSPGRSGAAIEER
jgi:hypothetical protein